MPKKRQLMQQVREVARQIKARNRHLSYLWLKVRWDVEQQSAEMLIQYRIQPSDKIRYGLISNGKTSVVSLSYKMCQELDIDAEYACGILRSRRFTNSVDL